MKQPKLMKLRGRASEARTALPRRPVPRTTNSSSDPLVSMTSYPARIAAAAIALRSVFLQSYRPGRVILVLAEPEFHKRQLPTSITALRRWGLEIHWVDTNIRSYKKLIPARRANPDALIVTADDDVVYPRWWLQRLMEAHTFRPEHVLAMRANQIEVDLTGHPRPYLEWTHSSLVTPSRLVFPTGMGGILYPPRSLPQRFLDAQLAMELCPNADDIWFRVGTWVGGTPVAVVEDHFHEFPAVHGTQRSSLQDVNVAGRQNDAQLASCLRRFGVNTINPASP